MVVVFVEVKSCRTKSDVWVGAFHGVEPRNCCATWLVFGARHFSSAASEHGSRNFHSRPVLVEQIPYARCLECQKKNQHWTDIVSNLSCLLGSR
jgi:hypothetical protein